MAGSIPVDSTNLRINMKAFFEHYSLEFAIRNGFDLVPGGLGVFVKENEELYKGSVSLSLKVGTEVAPISEWDIYQLSQGIATEAGEKLLDWAFDKSKISEDPMTNPLMVSMHSGSSDYLLPFKVLRDYDSFIKEAP